MGSISAALVWGVAVPIAVASTVVAVVRWLTATERFRIFAGPLGLACGYAAGWAGLAGDALLHPSSYWHYLPYLGAIAALLGGCMKWLVRSEMLRALLALAVCVFSAWMLVPDWRDLEPVAFRYTAGLAALLLVVFLASAPLADRSSGAEWLWAVLLAGCGQTITIAGLISFKLAQLSLLATSATAGCALIMLVTRSWSTAGLPLGLTVMLVGGAFVGAIQPQPPVAGLMILPAAPLALWLSGGLPIGRWPFLGSGVARLLPVMLLVAAVTVWLLIR